MKITWIRALSVLSLLLLGACGGNREFVPYLPYPCGIAARLDVPMDKDSAAAEVMITGHEASVSYSSVSGPKFYISTWLSQRDCIRDYADVHLQVPPGVYNLEAKFQYVSWTLGSVEFLPDVTYHLTNIALPYYDASAMKWGEGLTTYPLILRRYGALPDRNVVEIATVGAQDWNIGLTRAQITAGVELIRARTHTVEQFNAVRDNWLVENKRAIAQAMRPATASGFNYEGRYGLAEDDSCRWNSNSIWGRFIEISYNPENVAEYYVSFGAFLYDDANAIAWPEKVGPDGSLRLVIEDPKPATGSGPTQGPMTIQHRLTLKPRGDDFLMMTEWTRTAVDPNGVEEPTVIDMKRFHKDRKINPYFDRAGNDGFCLKRVGVVSG